MIIKIENVEMRSWEKRISRYNNNDNNGNGTSNNEYCLLYFEDIAGSSNKILCRNKDLLIKKFQKGEVADLYCTLEINRYTNFELIGINELDTPFN